jgi:hypothetical protein
MMMDNSTHHLQQVVQLNNVNPQPTIMKSPGEMENFLTIRLLMQGKVNNSSTLIFVFFHEHNFISRKSEVLLENVVIISKRFEKKVVLVLISVMVQHRNVLLPWLEQLKHYQKHLI